MIHFLSQRTSISITPTITATLLAVFGIVLEGVEDQNIKTAFIVVEQSRTFHSVLNPTLENIFTLYT